MTPQEREFFERVKKAQGGKYTRSLEQAERELYEDILATLRGIDKIKQNKETK